jgi:integrase
MTAHRKRQSRERLKAGPKWKETELVFVTDVGRALDGTNMTHRFQRMLSEAGLPRRRFHDLRHSCATVLLAQGVPARVVMDILGHSQISVTMNTYSHVLPEMQKDAAELMDGFLRGLGWGTSRQ